MKVLVGVPVFRVPDLVRDCLKSLTDTGADVLVIDNAADQDVKQLIAGFSDKITVIVNEYNMFCNGGWNQILRYGLDNEYDVIGLGSSDAVLHNGWYESIVKRFSHYEKEVVLPSIGEPVDKPDYTKADKVREGVPGFFSFLTKEAARIVYPIPSNLRHWFGDQYMFEKLRSQGWETVILQEVKAYHQQSAITFVTPEAYDIIKQDKMEWGCDYEPELHTPVSRFYTTRIFEGNPPRWRNILMKR